MISYDHKQISTHWSNVRSRLALSAHAFQELPRREAQREILESSYMSSSYVSKL